MINNYFGKKRGLSTIIGGFIFLVLMVGAFTALILGFQINTEIFETQVKVAKEEVIKAREQFTIIPSVKPSQHDRLYVQVENKGNSPVQINDVWIINKTSSPYNATRVEIEYENSFVSPGSKKQILDNSNTIVTLTKDTYDIKVVSELGTSVVKELVSPLRPLNSTMLLTSPHVSNGQNSTVFMEVVNRGNATVFDVKPSIDRITMVDPSDSVGEVLGPFPTQVNLEPQESVTFKWNYQMFGAVGTVTRFTNNATGIDSITGDRVYSDNSTDVIEFVPAAKTLLQTPDINAVIPYPFGETGQSATSKGLWGVVIANPTDQPIDVRRILINALSPTGITGIIPSTCGDGTNEEPIAPTVDGEWTCPAENLLKWENLADPERIPPRDAVQFLVKVQTGNPQKGADDHALLVSATVFSTFGQSSRTGLVTASEDGSNGVIANVYLSDPSKGGGDPLNTNSILGVTSKLASGTPNQMFNVTLADFSAQGSSDGISEDTILVVNMPSGFREVTVDTTRTNSNLIGPTCDPVSDPVPTVTEFPDGSNQILACLENDIGVDPDAEQNTLVFTADVPSVSSDAIYLVPILAQGSTTASDNFPIGPVAEGVIRVVPPP